MYNSITDQNAFDYQIPLTCEIFQGKENVGVQIGNCINIYSSSHTAHWLTIEERFNFEH